MITWAMAMRDLTIGNGGKKVKMYLTTLEAIMRGSLSSPMNARTQTATVAIDPVVGECLF